MLRKDNNIEALFRIHYEELCLFALKSVNELDAAEDIVQDVFVRLISKNVNLSDIENPRAYLYRSTRNTCINYMQSEQLKLKKKLQYAQQQEHTTSIEDSMKETISELNIYKAIDALPEKCRKVFTLCGIDNLKYKEAASQMDVSVNTIKTQMKIAYKILRTNLREATHIFF